MTPDDSAHNERREPSPSKSRLGAASPWDACLLVAERAARQVYWSIPALRRIGRRWNRRAPKTTCVVGRDALKDRLREVGVAEGSLVMVHTGVTALRWRDAGDPAPGGFAPAVASQLVDDLLELLGSSGTLVMPTHPHYQTATVDRIEDDSIEDEAIGAAAARSASGTTTLDEPIVYEPARTPCAVGLANELFRRRAGVQRSRHPWNPVAALGPGAAELLRDNLNDNQPLPHGVDSAYYRFCRHGGLLVSVGVPLGRYMTLIHTAEEVRDSEWPIPDFFEERRYVVRDAGEERTWTVRQTRAKYLKYCLCMRKLTRDLRREGILHESSLDALRVDWARSQEVFDYMMRRNERSTYPYYATTWVRRWK